MSVLLMLVYSTCALALQPALHATAVSFRAPAPSMGLGSFISKRILRRKGSLSTLTIAKFLSAPEEVDPELKGASIDTLIDQLKADGVSEATISLARTTVLPFLPGQEAPGVPSTEVGKPAPLDPGGRAGQSCAPG